MPQYSYIIRSSDHEHKAERRAVLQDVSMALPSADATSHRHFGLTEDEIFRLWRAALKDDDELVDDAIQKVYDDMISFDRERAETVMSLTIRRNGEAGRAFRSLLADLSK
jgi:hypothetical protein